MIEQVKVVCILMHMKYTRKRLRRGLYDINWKKIHRSRLISVLYYINYIHILYRLYNSLRQMDDTHECFISERQIKMLRFFVKVSRINLGSFETLFTSTLTFIVYSIHERFSLVVLICFWLNWMHLGSI